MTTPFAPWPEILTALAGSTGITLDSSLPFGNGPPTQSTDSLIQAVTAQLHQAAHATPLMLLLDDLHWADQHALDLLEYITRHIDRLPMLIVATYRSEEIQRNHPLYAFLPVLQRDRPTATIHLTAFAVDDTTRLVESQLGACTPGLVSYLHDRAEGHPLFLVELLHDLQEQALLTQDQQGRWLPPAQDIPVPMLLRQVITQRVARLGEQGETLLAVASVVGESWDLSVVERLLEWPEETLLTTLERALAAHLVEAADARLEQYRFSHGLIREVLYRHQLPRRRRHLHRRIAEQLEARLAQEATPNNVAGASMTHDDLVGTLAHHYYQAEEWPQAFHYCQAAGDAARRRSATHTFIHFLRQALAVAQRNHTVSPPKQIFDLYEKLGAAHILLYQKEQARAVYQQMVEAARTIADKRAEVQALFRLAETEERMHDHEHAKQTRQAALALAEAVADPYLLAFSHISFGHHHTARGGLDRALHHLGEAERHARTSNNPYVLFNSLRYKIYIVLFQGAYDDAKQLAQLVLAHAQETGNLHMLVNAYWLLGFALVEQGCYEEALHSLQQALAQSDTIGERHYNLIRVRNMLGYLYREVGDLAAATEWSQHALATNEHDGSPYAYECACYSLLDLATTALVAGDKATAESYFQQFKADYGQPVYAWYRYGNRAQLFQAELALAAHDYSSAINYATAAEAIAQAESMQKNIIKCQLYQGQALLGLQRPQEALPPLQEAITLADKIGHGSLRWQTRLALAEAHAQLGRPADELYHAAWEMVESIAANLHTPHLHHAFLNSPLVVALREKVTAAATEAPAVSTRVKTEPTAAPPYPAGLTGREVEVLQLVAQGYTDRQISAALTITVRTVNTHVTNILNKIGCENRTAAATFAAQNNLIGSPYIGV
ncbi:MAG: LuxR C-terminal-related transcriptional regulator [Caldilineaceae bacterium]